MVLYCAVPYYVIYFVLCLFRSVPFNMHTCEKCVSWFKECVSFGSF